MVPVLLQIGSFRLHAFGVLVAMGFIVSMAYTTRETERQGFHRNDFLDLTFFAMIEGILGARIFFAITNYHLFTERPWEVLYVWQGGLVWYGGLIFGFVGGLIFTKVRKVPTAVFADIAAPAIMLGLSVGRIGCWAVGDDHGRLVESALGDNGRLLAATNQLYDLGGYVTDQARQLLLTEGPWPWWTTVLPANSLVQRDLVGLPLFPAQLLMSLGTFTIYLLLDWWKTRQRFTGELMVLMWVLYPIHRFGIELIRGDIDRGTYGWFTTSQWISLTGFSIACLTYWYCYSQSKKNGNLLTTPVSTA